ncbi:hypothetical protein C1752_16668 [Acaryochloris thomasi RCC1774]|uniref:Uncharacterized protein n=1 Tax=Acaryochloris thomasi RCC1774 TaxID=1764569 RepID=A0A2W1JIW2_9CYAN|nr:hypothetical protein [Acaryochloris thomasi]PZD70204.1 hypothetical protein C1752_16668 [Acaryochloris thomasi RCC1774]
MTQATPERLDRIEAMLERLVNVQSNHQETLDRLVEAQLAGDVLRGQIAQQTMQLKRAVDYLMSKDGESG